MRSLFLLLFCASVALPQSRLNRYAVVLDTLPVVRETNPEKLSQARAAQANVRAAIETQGVKVLHSTSRLVNAVYVTATPEQAAGLRRLYGVSRVEPIRTLTRQLNKAVDLVNAPAAWNIVGGPDRAGQGVKIGILDSGIDITHPSLTDNSTPLPAGFPKCQGVNCDYTNRKVIAARSYVDLLVMAEDPANSRPDDLSPRDRVGHGTAAASIAAGKLARGPAAEIRGVAPGAFLGNYKIFGSPGINDYTFDDVVIAALEDALADGMNIVNLSIGGPALWAASDRGEVCGAPANEACDLLVEAVENAVSAGLTVVTAAGNDGATGLELPTLNSIQSPGIAPGVITVGASTNGHAFYAGVTPEGGSRMRALFGNGPRIADPLTAPLRDVALLGSDGRACATLPENSLAGMVALIERGDCALSTKIVNAQRAGAAAVIIYQAQGNSVTTMYGLADTGIPAVLIGRDDGLALKRRNEAPVKLDPALQAEDAAPDYMAIFSSQGPTIGDSLIKPELTAVGTDIYVATQKYDPNGDMYDPSGYLAAQGTSFASPMVAGAAAIALQRYPNLTPGQVKSLLVNSAADLLTDFDYSGNEINAPWTAGGNGLLDVRAMARSSVTVEPATVSFGVLDRATPAPTRTLILTNLSGSVVNLRFDAAPSSALTLSPTSLAIPPNSSRELRVRLNASSANPGAYEGSLNITGGAIPLRVPFLYLVSDNRPFNIFPLRGDGFSGIVNEELPSLLALKVVDRNGVPIEGATVRWSAGSGGGEVLESTRRTDNLGIAVARVRLGPQLGDQEFQAVVGSLSGYFQGTARLRPSIRSSGVVNAGSLLPEPISPGSYIAIFGQGLADSARLFSTPYLPLSLSGVSVSFDVPGRGVSLPARIMYISDGQINALVPWELAGYENAQVKVSIGNYSSRLFDVGVRPASPAAFEYEEAGTGRTLVAARDEAFLLVGSANPARRGRIIQLYCNGLGPVSNAPASGEPAPSSPLAVTLGPASVTIGGVPARVDFSGLTPGAAGLYQVNVEVPAGAPAGLQPVVISINGVNSKPVNLVVQ